MVWAVLIQRLAWADNWVAWVSKLLYGAVVYRTRVPRPAQCTWAMFRMYWATELLPYSTVEEYWAVAVAKMSAPFRASIPVWERYSITGPYPMAGEYMREKMSRAFVRCSSLSMVVST